MKEYDAIVIGSGCGMNIVLEALAHHLRVALVDRGPLGGTCPNTGCIPSKILIHVADRMVEAEAANRLGARVEVKGADFRSVMERMRAATLATREQMRMGMKGAEGLDYYEGEGHFTDEYTLEIGGEQIRARRIFIASGSRPFVPPLQGLDRVPYMTSETLLELTERPDSLAIVGGGYVGVEYGHFFATMGSRVTIIEMSERLVSNEEPEIANLLERELASRMSVHTNTTVEGLRSDAGGIVVVGRERASGQAREFRAERLLLAAGRSSNADVLKAEKCGIELDSQGYVKVNEYMETNKKRVYAVGDANGRYMFTHVANKESALAAHNAIHNGRARMDYSAVPHAVYAHPQIAAVGLGEEEARKRHKLLIGRARYADVAKGEAMMEKSGFAKVLVDRENGRILGFHIIGPYAAIVAQEVINAMAVGGSADAIRAGMHIHPELPEIVQSTLANLQEA